MTDTSTGTEHEHVGRFLAMMGEDGSIGFGIPVQLIPEGGAEMPDMDKLPDELRELFTGSFAEVMGRIMAHAKRQAFAEDVRKYVTPEIANHVLAEYGDDQASLPGLAPAALISLIRISCACDDDMLYRVLNADDDLFRGYVLAIKFLMEAPGQQAEGRKTLRVLAGLDPVPDDAE